MYKLILASFLLFSSLYFQSCKEDDPDDIEVNRNPYSLLEESYWVMASTPQGQPAIFPNGELSNDLKYNFGRAHLAWYVVAEIFYRGNSSTPSNIDVEMLSHHNMREVVESELGFGISHTSGIPATLRTLDLAYFPNERGPYNYDANNITNDGYLKDPSTNWAGIMRRIEVNNFEANSIKYINFWLMDPFADLSSNQTSGGTIYLHLGEISEDVLRDGYMTFENGFPKDKITTEDNSIKTVWGFAPSSNLTTYVFNNDPASRMYQDIGFDGLNNTQEQSFFKEVFLDKLSSSAYSKFISDPSGDDFQFYKSDILDRVNADIIERYKYHNNFEGNSPMTNSNTDFPATGWLSPNTEDINNDYKLNEKEAYYQYPIKIKHKDDPIMQVGQNYIEEKRTATINLKNGKTSDVLWYIFKIPVLDYEKKIGMITNFRSIRFMRLVMTDFEEPVVCRFAKLQLVKDQ